MTDPGRTTRRIAAIISGTSRISPEQIVASLTRHSGDSGSRNPSRKLLCRRQRSRRIKRRGRQRLSSQSAAMARCPTLLPASSARVRRWGSFPRARPTSRPDRWEFRPNRRPLSLYLAGPTRLRAIDIGRSEDRSFVHIAGAGFDAALFQGASPVWKRRLGWFAYLPAAVTALRLPPSDVRITADGAVFEARSSLVLIANGGSAIAPQFRIYPGITVDDGWLDVLIFTSSTPTQIASNTRLCGDAATRSISPRPAPPHAHRGDRGSASPSRGARRGPARNHAPAVPHRSSGTARRRAAPSA